MECKLKDTKLDKSFLHICNDDCITLRNMPNATCTA